MVVAEARKPTRTPHYAQALVLRIPIDRARVEHGSIDADPLHRRTLRQIDADGAAGAAADRAGHVLLQRDFRADAMLRGKRGNGLEHRRRTAGVDHGPFAGGGIRGVEPAPREIRDQTVEAAREALPARESRRYSPAFQKRHAAIDALRDAGEGQRRCYGSEGEGDLGS